MVVATGKLLADQDRFFNRTPRFKLGGDVKLCSLGPPPPDAGSAR
jgi:hypothetical protein